MQTCSVRLGLGGRLIGGVGVGMDIVVIPGDGGTVVALGVVVGGVGVGLGVVVGGVGVGLAVVAGGVVVGLQW